MNRKERNRRKMELRRGYAFIGEDWRKPILRGHVERARVNYIGWSKAHKDGFPKPRRPWKDRSRPVFNNPLVVTKTLYHGVIFNYETPGPVTPVDQGEATYYLLDTGMWTLGPDFAMTDWDKKP